jgi:CubicO group peptidase (beta-lactamase class C family)
VDQDSLKPDTRFQLASLSKTFTAVGVLKLMEEGKLKLKDLLTDFFPELPFKKVTVEMLLSHRSGIPNYVNLFGDMAVAKDLHPDNKELIGWLANTERRYIDRPGRNFSYSNSNYALLASIIEKVSGMTYSNYMRAKIFDPLGMKDTWLITDSTEEALKNRAWSYTPQWEKKPADNFDGVLGDKGIFSTVDDLLKWYNALTGYKVLSKETIESAWKPRSFEKPGARNYGYGFRMLGDHDTDKVVFHNGWWNSYNSLFYIQPYHKFVVIVLGNKYNPDIYDIHQAVAVMSSRKPDPKVKLGF